MATAAAVSESRGDLLAWINDLLCLSVAKIEHMGSGAVLCQLMDSIYGDVPMARVKFNTVQPYEYVNNFKVLQSCFTRHRIDKVRIVCRRSAHTLTGSPRCALQVIPVERLVKMKFQDNLVWPRLLPACSPPPPPPSNRVVLCARPSGVSAVGQKVLGRQLSRRPL